MQTAAAATTGQTLPPNTFADETLMSAAARPHRTEAAIYVPAPASQTLMRRSR